jgi:hypothetical protein
MFWSKTDTDESRGNAAKEWPDLHQFHRPWERDLLIRAENLPNKAVLYENLHSLCQSRGQFAPLLNQLKIPAARRQVARQNRTENVGGSNRILDCQIDADASNWRHCMRRIAYA